MPSPERPWVAFALLGVAVVATGFQLWLPGVLPQATDHQTAGEVLARESKPGDVVLLHPWWTERARLFIQAGLPIVGYLGSDADPLEDFERIWVLSQPQLPRAGTADFEAAFRVGRTPIGPPRQLGPLSLGLHANGRFRPTRFRASEELAEATVAIEAGDTSAPCARDAAEAFRCRQGGGAAVGWHELRFVPQRCIAVQPPGGKARLSVTFPRVPLTRTLVLEAGILWEHAAKHHAGVTELVVGVEPPGGAPLAVIRIPPGQEGFRRMELPGHEGPLRVWIQSERVEERQACIQLRAIDGPSSEGAR